MKKTAILYGERQSGQARKALEILSECLLDYTEEYPICLPIDTEMDTSVFRCVYIGTKADNPYIREHSSTVLTHAEEYSICVADDTVIIEGSDPNGLLYGCVDFYNKYIVPHEQTHDSGCYFRNIFEGTLPDDAISSYPSAKKRGIWTWGHVIYDYRGFLDSMVRLKMNTITIWNDFPPTNARELIALAHEYGIRVIWGYSWFWNTDCAAVDIEEAYASGGEILAQYERDYRDLGGDGIYFQSFTELNRETIGGVLIAEAVTEFVNRTSALFFEKYPDLELQFGLHANSVSQRLEYIRRVDPRVRIVWENCGAFPFSYIPSDVATFDETAAFVEKIAHLRGDAERFGVVTKAFTKLDWSAFTHPAGPMTIGVSSAQRQDNRILRKHKIWRYVQAYWLTNAAYAQKMVQLLCRETAGEGDISALVEDGMLEKQIPYIVALYAEMLWDCDSPIESMMSAVALREWVTFN